jgi:hypothetical protein
VSDLEEHLKFNYPNITEKELECFNSLSRNSQIGMNRILEKEFQMRKKYFSNNPGKESLENEDDFLAKLKTELCRELVEKSLILNTQKKPTNIPKQIYKKLQNNNKNSACNKFTHFQKK